MAIKRNSTVTNIVDIITVDHHKITIPAGSTLTVYKVKRNGTVYCHHDTHRYNVIVTTKDNLKEVTQLNPVKVNDIFVSSGGYEQTNVAFYKVTKVTKSSAYVVEIGCNRNYTGPMNGEATPNDYDTSNVEPKQVRLNIYNNNPTFKAIWGNAYPWNGKPCFFSEWH